MRKDKCVQRWIEYNLHNGSDSKIATIAKNSNRIAIAHAMVIPATKRFQNIQYKFESGKYLLGYKSCLEEVTSAISSLLIDLEYSIAMFYKKQHTDPAVKQLISVFNLAKELSLEISMKSNELKKFLIS